MVLFKQSCIFLLLVNFLTPAIAAVDDAIVWSCGSYSAADQKDEKTEGEESEEEPDCE